MRESFLTCYPSSVIFDTLPESESFDNRPDLEFLVESDSIRAGAILTSSTGIRGVLLWGGDTENKSSFIEGYGVGAAIYGFCYPMSKFRFVLLFYWFFVTAIEGRLMSG